MSFVKLVDMASSAAIGENVVLFPNDGEITREDKISRATCMAERARNSLLQCCGVTGAARIFTLLIEEMVEAHCEDVAVSKNLSRKMARLSKVFSEEAVR
jgi:hypothetical protein